jgi:hypothetical protein
MKQNQTLVSCGHKMRLSESGRPVVCWFYQTTYELRLRTVRDGKVVGNNPRGLGTFLLFMDVGGKKSLISNRTSKYRIGGNST